MTDFRFFERVPAAVLGWLSFAAVALLPDRHPVLIVLVATYLLLGPGMAILGICGPALRARPAAAPAGATPRDHTVSDWCEWLLLAVGLSLAVDGLVCTGLLLGNQFAALQIIGVLASLTSSAALFPPLPVRPPGEAEPEPEAEFTEPEGEAR
ncbi:hypothetical protein [Streptomyces boninensis]|uniref:hypothetical protein n=1 Tax=Streptomyces boninensis TaxID=2039455 RepID=UPI003B2199E6